MIDIKKIYKKEKIINEKFRKTYDYSNPNIFYKQVLQLIVELSELAYETKCFKYWKKDKASEVDVIISEYADCLMIILCFCDLSNIEITNLPKVYEKDIVKQFITLNKLATQITMDDNKDILLQTLSNLLNLSKLLNFTDEDLAKYCSIKMDKTLAIISKKCE